MALRQADTVLLMTPLFGYLGVRIGVRTMILWGAGREQYGDSARDLDVAGNVTVLLGSKRQGKFNRHCLFFHASENVAQKRKLFLRRARRPPGVLGKALGCVIGRPKQTLIGDRQWRRERTREARRSRLKMLPHNPRSAMKAA